MNTRIVTSLQLPSCTSELMTIAHKRYLIVSWVLADHDFCGHCYYDNMVISVKQIMQFNPEQVYVGM